MSEIGREHNNTKDVNDSGTELIGDMLREILARSSVNSLLTYKSVSRSWRDLISGQDFIDLHMKHSDKSMQYVICRLAENSRGGEVCLMDKDGAFTTIPFPGFLQGSLLRVISSFNGVLFITCDISGNELVIFTCNPATRRIHLIRDGSTSVGPVTAGIAFNLKDCQYKVFRFFKDSFKSEDCYACEVYAPGSKSWKRIESVRYRPQVAPYSSCNDQVCIDGTLYWFGCPEKDLREATFPACIMSVSMNDEKFKTIDFPGSQEVNQFSFLINLEGRLSIVKVDCPNLFMLGQSGLRMPDFPAQAHLWLSEDLSQSTWFLKTSFQIRVPGIYTFKSVVARKSDIFFIIADVNDELHYHIYHVADSSWSVLELPHNDYHPTTFKWPVAFPFAESLYHCGGDNRFTCLIRDS